VVAKKVGAGSPAIKDLAGDAIKFGRGDARFGSPAGGVVHLRHDPTRPAHFGNFLDASSHSSL
jgi:hypothetical protein